MFNKNFVDDRIRTADLWFRTQLLYQLSHKHCPVLYNFLPFRFLLLIPRHNFQFRLMNQNRQKQIFRVLSQNGTSGKGQKGQNVYLNEIKSKMHLKHNKILVVKSRFLFNKYTKLFSKFIIVRTYWPFILSKHVSVGLKAQEAVKGLRQIERNLTEKKLPIK